MLRIFSDRLMFCIPPTIAAILATCQIPPPRPAAAQGPMPVARSSKTATAAVVAPKTALDERPRLKAIVAEVLQAVQAVETQRQAAAATAESAQQSAAAQVPPPSAREAPKSVTITPTQSVIAPQPPVTDPKIVLECPTEGLVGQITVVKAGQSSNIRLMQIEVAPSVDTYFNPANKELVFSVKEEGTWTVTVTATSPDGGLAKAVRTITFGDPRGPGPKSHAAPTPQQVDYYKYVQQSAKEFIASDERKADSLAMAGAFRAAMGLTRTGGIRTRDELFKATDTLIGKGLGNNEESCKEFILDLLKKTAAEHGGLDRLLDVWEQIAAGLERVGQ